MTQIDYIFQHLLPTWLRTWRYNFRMKLNLFHLSQRILTMTHDDKEFLKEFMRGASVTVVLVGTFVLFIALIGIPESPQNGVESPKFRVVNQYKNCDVVRYVDESNRYQYFLDCSKQ